MSRSILVPLDGSEPAKQALEFALEQHPDAEITAYHVINIELAASQTALGGGPTHESSLYEAAEENAESVLSGAEALAREYDTEIETKSVRGLPPEEITDYAEDSDVDQIIMGSHGRSGVKRMLIGSVAEKVARHTTVPITIVHPGDES